VARPSATLHPSLCPVPIELSSSHPHSSSVFQQTDGLYEEVNKDSLSKHYIGLHNESTFKKTAKAGAFVCFKPATEWGGEFFIADGERIFRDMDPEVLKTIAERKVQASANPSIPPSLLSGPSSIGKDPVGGRRMSESSAIWTRTC
jgi:hypothetical protein